MKPMNNSKNKLNSIKKKEKRKKKKLFKPMPNTTLVSV